MNCKPPLPKGLRQVVARQERLIGLSWSVFSHTIAGGGDGGGGLGDGGGGLGGTDGGDGGGGDGGGGD
eukprot:scaffold67195_cov39-Phaeocystis_antarctica.AAC.1